MPIEQKASKVADVFDSVAQQYDVMNDLMSFGVHRLWKWMTVHASAVRPGHRVLDLAGGTGDLAYRFRDVVGEQGHVVLADINASMLTVGRDTLIDRGAVDRLHYVQADAQDLPFPDHYFDCVSMAFGLRNVTDKDEALRSIWRVLKPGGRVLILEFSKPTSAVFSKVYDWYSFRYCRVWERVWPTMHPAINI